MTDIVSANIPVAYIEADGTSVENHMAAAAAYLSWVAYPGRDQVDRAARFVKAVRAIPYKDRNRPRPRKQAPLALRGIKPESIDGSIRDAREAVYRHYSARWMAMKLMGMDADFLGVKTGHGVAVLFCDPSATKDRDRGAMADQGDPHHIADRIWKHALPALAMNMALPYKLQTDGGSVKWLQHHRWAEMGFPDATILPPSIGNLLGYPDWVKDAVEAAAIWAIALPKKLPEAPKTLLLPQIIAVRA